MIAVEATVLGVAIVGIGLRIRGVVSSG